VKMAEKFKFPNWVMLGVFWIALSELAFFFLVPKTAFGSPLDTVSLIRLKILCLGASACICAIGGIILDAVYYDWMAFFRFIVIVLVSIVIIVGFFALNIWLKGVL
jgi:hypothetical protein